LIRPAEVRERVSTSFSERTRARGNGLFSTDEGDRASSLAPNRIRVAAEVPIRQGGVQELWAHFSLPGSWRSYRTSCPRLVVCRRRHLDLRRLEFRQPSPRRRSRVVGAGSIYRCVSHLRREVGYLQSRIRTFFMLFCEHLGLPEHQVLCVACMDIDICSRRD